MEEESRETGHCLGDVILPLPYSGKENINLILYSKDLWDKEREEPRWFIMQLTSYQDAELQKATISDIKGYREHTKIYHEEVRNIGYTDSAVYYISESLFSPHAYDMTILYEGDTSVQTQPALEVNLTGGVDKDELPFFRELFESIKIYHRPGAFGEFEQEQKQE